MLKMADKKPSSFKTFILLMFTFALASFLGCGAFLMLSPESTLFGLCYISNVEEEPITQVSTGTSTSTALHFYNYEKVIVDTSNDKTGNASVEVNCGTAGNSLSTIILDKCSRGFAYADARKDYSITVSAASHILYITLIEPQYNFIQITNSTVLKLNVCSTENIQNVEFEIETNNGSVTFGGPTTPTSTAQPLTTPTLTVESQNGSIIVDDSTTIRNEMALSTVEGAIAIQGNQNTTNVSLSALKGNIVAKDFTNASGTVNFESYNSHIKVGDIAGDAVISMTSGTFEFSEIGGSLSAIDTIAQKIQYTYIYGTSVGGDISISNLDGSFTVRIGSAGGTVSIYGGRLIKIDELLGQTHIKTTGGAIDVKKASTNSSVLTLESTANGAITAKFEAVFGTNTITTNSGAINVSFKITSQYFLSASTSGRILRTWLDSTTNPLVDEEVGTETPSTANNLTLTSTIGNITIGRY